MRNCSKCGEKMKCLKNGFYFTNERFFYSSDLWGCSECRTLEIHGIPKPMFEAHAVVDGSMEPDNDNPDFHSSIPEPKIGLFSDGFHEHMRRWNPDFPYKTTDEKWVTGKE